MSANNVADRTRNAVRGSWGITQFALMIAAAFAPIYLGIGIGFLIPVGDAIQRPGWLLGLIILLLPVGWFIVSQPLVLIGRVGAGFLLRESPRWSRIVAEAVEAVIAYIVLILCMRMIFDSFAPGAVGALVAVILYTVFEPYVERRYNSQPRENE